jgi:hypothetical protein
LIDRPTIGAVKIVAYVPDLMDRSRFDSVEGEKVFIGTPAGFDKTGSEDIAVADIGRAGALDALTNTTSSRRVAYVSHVDTDAIAQAKAAGVEVFPRSRFFSRIGEILGQGEH